MPEKKPISKAQKQPAKPQPRPYVVIDKRNGWGWLITLFIISGSMFFLGVLVGRNTLPVRFDMDNWEESLVNLKESVLKNRNLFHSESVHPVDVLAQLQEKGKKPSVYKQYIPPVIKPRFSKTDPTGDIPADEREKSGPQSQITADNLLPAASAEPAKTETPQKTAEIEGPDPSLASETAAASGTAGLSETGETPETTGKPPAETPPAMIVKTARSSKPDPGAAAAKTPEPGYAPASSGEPPPVPPVAAAPVEAYSPVELTSTEPASVEPASVEPASVEPASVEPAPVEPVPVESLSIETVSVEPVPVEPVSIAPAPVEPPPAIETIPPVRPADPSPPLYAIQVASLQNREKADSVKQKFMAKGYPAYAQGSEIKGVTWYRVRIGPYPNRAMAEKDCSSLKEAGVDGLVFRIEQ